jgi:hypothetical protein
MSNKKKLKVTKSEKGQQKQPSTALYFSWSNSPQPQALHS